MANVGANAGSDALQMDKFSSQATAVMDQISTKGVDIQSLFALITELMAEMSTVKGKIGVLNGRLAAERGKKKPDGNAISRMQSEIAQLQGRLVRMSGRLESAQKDLKKAEKELDQLQTSKLPAAVKKDAEAMKKKVEAQRKALETAMKDTADTASPDPSVVTQAQLGVQAELKLAEKQVEIDIVGDGTIAEPSFREAIKILKFIINTGAVNDELNRTTGRDVGAAAGSGLPPVTMA